MKELDGLYRRLVEAVYASAFHAFEFGVTKEEVLSEIEQAWDCVSELNRTKNRKI